MIDFILVIPTYYYDKGVINIFNNMPLNKKNITINIYDNTQNNKIYNIYIKYKKKSFISNLYYHRNRPVKAASINWNFGINDQIPKLKKNTYLIVLHQDEYLSKNFFSNLKSIIKKNNTPDVVSYSTILVKKKKFYNKIHTTARQRKFFYDFNFYYILKRNFIGPTSSIAIKLKKKPIFFNNSILWLVDVDYYIRLFLFFKHWIFTDEIFVYSDQLNKNSLTLKLKKKICLLNKSENKLIKKKYNLKNDCYLNMLDIFIWVSIRIYNKIKFFLNYKKFFK